MRRNVAIYCLLMLVTYIFAQGPNNTGIYYSGADGKKGYALKTAMHNIISGHKQLSYNALWEAFKETDRRTDGKVWDMYSNITNYTFGADQGKTYKTEGDTYNREHSFPKSWFDDGYPMYTDLVHLIPTDGYVNGRRSNYSYGETYGDRYTSSGGFSKLGASTVSGYSGTVFEPNDEYKGDFARIYFYMATCYEDRIDGWSSDMLAGNKTTVFTDWALKMLLRWAAEDPVSQKEINRNNAVYDVQNNRNPFVDYPGLEQYIWGSKKDMAFSYDSYDATNPDPGTDPNPGDNPNPGDDPNPGTDPVEGENTYARVTSTADLTTGCGYLIVCESKSTAMAASGNNIRNYAAVEIKNDKIVTKVNEDGLPYHFVLGGVKDDYTFYDTKENVYLSLTSSENKLHNSESVVDDAKWVVTIEDGNTQIQNKNRSERYIQYNASSPRFACYKSSQMPVALYKCTTNTAGVNNPTLPNVNTVNVYTVTGTLVRSNVEGSRALNGLHKGVYIVNKRKYIVR